MLLLMNILKPEYLLTCGISRGNLGHILCALLSGIKPAPDQTTAIYERAAQDPNVLRAILTHCDVRPIFPEVHLANCIGRAQWDSLRLLLASPDFPVNSKLHNGNTPLHVACAMSRKLFTPDNGTDHFVELSHSEKRDVLTMLLNAGADPTICNNDRKRPGEMLPDHHRAFESLLAKQQTRSR